MGANYCKLTPMKCIKHGILHLHFERKRNRKMTKRHLVH